MSFLPHFEDCTVDYVSILFVLNIIKRTGFSVFVDADFVVFEIEFKFKFLKEIYSQNRVLFCFGQVEIMLTFLIVDIQFYRGNQAILNHLLEFRFEGELCLTKIKIVTF